MPLSFRTSLQRSAPVALAGLIAFTFTIAPLALAQSATGAQVSLPTAPASAVAALPAMHSEADLQSTLNDLFMEHTYLAGDTIAGLVMGNSAQVQAAGTGLDINTQQIGTLVGSLYGQQAQQQFLTLWRRHLTDYMQYTQAGMNNDSATQQQARQDLLQFANDMEGLLRGADPNIPSGLVANGLTMHVQGTMQVIDALLAKDLNTAYSLGKQGADMTAMLGTPLAMAIAQQFPNQFPMSASASGTATTSSGAGGTSASSSATGAASNSATGAATSASACPVLSLGNPNPGDMLPLGGYIISGTASAPSGVARVDLFLGAREQGGTFLGSARTGTAPGGNPNAFQIQVTIPAGFNRGANFAAYAIANNGQQTSDIFPVYVGPIPTRAAGAATPTPIPTNAAVVSSCAS